jgi:hypothetical protein
MLVRVFEDQLFITARALCEYWEVYPTTIKPPPIGKIGRALAGLADTKKQLMAGNGKPTNYWPIKTEHLLTWADEMSYCAPAEILGLLKTTSNGVESMLC